MQIIPAPGSRRIGQSERVRSTELQSIIEVFRANSTDPVDLATRRSNLDRMMGASRLVEI